MTLQRVCRANMRTLFLVAFIGMILSLHSGRGLPELKHPTRVYSEDPKLSGKLVSQRLVEIPLSRDRTNSVGPSSPPALSGIWEHDRCVAAQGESGSTNSSRATFAFFEHEWGLSYSQYADGECHDKLLTVTFRGTYTLTGASEHLPGASNATFRFSYKGMAIYDAALVKQVNQSGSCGSGDWIQELEHDISATGCLWVESISVCPQEYDLALVNGNALFLGERPAKGKNICDPSRRPSRLRTIPLIKK
jgi:hypothetical protein